MAASKAGCFSDSLALYQHVPGLVLGFHGCDQTVGKKFSCKLESNIKPNGNAWDWRGAGIYFWGNDPRRAFEFAKMKRKHLGISNTPIKKSYSFLRQVYEAGGMTMPENEGREGVWRHLDCAMLQNMHLLRREADLPRYDTVRGLFWKGKPLYPNAGMKSQNHVQIAVMNKASIRGYFRPFAWVFNKVGVCWHSRFDSQ